MKPIIKTPCGMRDLDSIDIKLREYIFNKVIPLFKCRGGKPIDTPVAEIFTSVHDIYGEEFNKEVYRFDDDSTEPLMLRYDLTLPLARYIAYNGLVSFRRYQIGKVYRKDNPQITRGRYREFYQCDFDIIGDDKEQMVYDIEVLELLHSILKALLNDKFTIRFNHRQIILNILKHVNIDKKDYSGVCITLDKLDKKSIEEIEDELIKIRGLDKEVAFKLIDIIQKIKNDNLSLSTYLNKLKNNKFLDNKTYEKLQLLITILNDMNIDKAFILDPTLIRGLDYYTGLIFEAHYIDKALMPSSIAGGGRYDNMLGLLSKHTYIPAIGLSIGIERIVTILEETNKALIQTLTEIDTPYVFVAGVGKDTLKHRILFCTKCRNLGINTAMSYQRNPKMGNQLNTVFENNIPFMIIIGENEINSNTVTIKDIHKNTETKININDALDYLKSQETVSE